MKKALILILILLLSISAVGCDKVQLKPEGENSKEAPQTVNDEAAVKSVVEKFGKKLQFVSLLGPEDVLEKSMEENYGEFVSPTLIEKWLKDPVNAPGRLTSSPWPDRIEISNIEKTPDGKYEVEGEIIEVTSVDNGESVAKRAVTLVVEKIEGKWLITEAELGDYEDTDSVVYENTRYGFTFSLPETWKGYKIITEEWEGLSLVESNEGEVVQTGPLLLLRHPEWTAEKKRQDIPIMIFTLDQWESLEKGEFHIGAAPIGPKELARNSKYVFALPARYNFAFPEGHEEVEKILEGNPLQVTENMDK